MTKNNTFEIALAGAAKLPFIKVDREDYLRKELKFYCTKEEIELAVDNNPAYAGIDVSTINKIAENAINYETKKVSMLSAAAGFPGGLAMYGTIPADLAQYTGHMLIILQKLVYLYGWGDLIGDNGFDEETTGKITLFMGVMFGVNTASTAIGKISISAAQQASKKLASQALTKTAYYPIIKKVSTALGVKMTKEIFAKSVTKVIPIIGAITSGGITYITFKPMANKLKRHLAGLSLCDVSYYEQQKNSI